MKYLLLTMFLASCGQVNQAVDCIRNGEQCEDKIPAVQRNDAPPAPCSINPSSEPSHPVEIVVPVAVLLEEEAEEEDKMVYQCTHPKHLKHKNGKGRGHDKH